MILIDTAAWVEVLRDTGWPVCGMVDKLLAEDIATCDPVMHMMEALAGARSEQHVQLLRGFSPVHRWSPRNLPISRSPLRSIAAAASEAAPCANSWIA